MDKKNFEVKLYNKQILFYVRLYIQNQTPVIFITKLILINVQWWNKYGDPLKGHPLEHLICSQINIIPDTKLGSLYD
jgi:hypothetical protein